MKFLIELNIDGYEPSEEEYEVCMNFIKEQLEFLASSIEDICMKNVERTVC